LQHGQQKRGQAMPEANPTSHENKIIEIPLLVLRPGHKYPGGSINVRTANCDEEIEQLAASIKNEGLLQSLTVVSAPGHVNEYFVADGERRLKACELLAKHGDIKAEIFLVPCIFWGEIKPTEALRKSLAANMHVPLHPVDRHRVFLKLQKDENTEVPEIAARYAVSENVVKQSLALAQLAPAVLDAWRAGDITASDAKAFACNSDHKLQAEVFKKFKKEKLFEDNGDWRSSDPQERKAAIQEELVGDAREIEMLLKYVSKKSYEAHGGKINRDLFDEELEIADIQLLRKLTEEKLNATVKQLTGEGWAWAAPIKTLPSNADWQWQKLPEGKKAAAAKKATAGCILKLNQNGQLDITYGVIKPGKAKAAAVERIKSTKAKEAPKKEEPARLSVDAIIEINETLQGAVAETLEENTQDAIAALLAGFMSWGKGPVKVSARGHASDDIEEMSFKEAYAAALKLPQQQKLEGLARIAVSAMDFGYSSKSNLHKSEVLQLVESLDQTIFNKKIKEFFDPTAYFKGAPKPLILQAIEECKGKEAAEKMADSKKADLATAAVKAVKEKGWLPIELRTIHYIGPGELAEFGKPQNKKKAAKK
jgi:ParB family chromosome partitioning protein